MNTAWFLGHDDLRDAHQVRRAVFIDEQRISESDEMDGTDSSCVHLVAYSGETPVATGRIMVGNEEFVIGRVAVIPDYRGQHMGDLIVRMLIRACYAMGGERQVVHAQLSARGFYEKLGFAPFGAEYLEAGLPHINMEHWGDCEPICESCSAKAEAPARSQTPTNPIRFVKSQNPVKKAVLMIMALLMVTLFSGNPILFEAAQAKKATLIMCMGGTSGLINGDAKPLSDNGMVSPFMEQGFVYIPLSYVADAYGYKVKWNSRSKRAILTSPNTEITFTVGRTEAINNNRTIQLSAPVLLRASKTYVNIQDVALAFNLTDSYENGLILLGEPDAVQKILDDPSTHESMYTRCNGLPIIGSAERLYEMTHAAGLSYVFDEYDGVIMYATANEAGVNNSAPSAAPSPSANNDSAATTAAPSETTDYSVTNTQVSGVDEGDVIKTDGTHLFYLSNNTVSVVKAVPPENMTLEYSLTFDDPSFRPVEIYIDNGIAVVIGQTYARTDNRGYYGGGRDMTQTYVYDTTDKQHIKLIREVSSEGAFLSSRKIKDALYIVSNQSLYNLIQNDQQLLTPQCMDSVTDAGYTDIGYDRIFYFPGAQTYEYMTVTGLLLTGSQPASFNTYFGAGKEIYVSSSYLYAAASHYGYRLRSLPESESNPYGPITSLYKFRLTDGQALFMREGEVPGSVLNQFSMDEHEGFFRIATTGMDRQYNNTNNLYVLDQNLSLTGRIENIAPEERIYSVRFMGQRGYMVTFKNVDPLFAFDLSDPYEPKLMGALKIPGYSDYLHPYDENHLIGFGKDTQEYNGTAYYQGMKLSMFDISDINQPKELFTEIIGGRGTESELLSNHRALLFDKGKNILAFPVTIMETSSDNATAHPTQYGQFVFQGARVYSIDMKKGFQLRGELTHLSESDLLKSGQYGSDMSKYIRRMLYIKDALYSASETIIKANRLSDLKPIGEVKLR